MRLQVSSHFQEMLKLYRSRDYKIGVVHAFNVYSLQNQLDLFLETIIVDGPHIVPDAMRRQFGTPPTVQQNVILNPITKWQPPCQPKFIQTSVQNYSLY